MHGDSHFGALQPEKHTTVPFLQAFTQFASGQNFLQLSSYPVAKYATPSRTNRAIVKHTISKLYF